MLYVASGGYRLKYLIEQGSI